jgi:hypothetical protein
MNQTIIIPTKLSDITLFQYLEYEGLPDNLDERNRLIKTISIFCNMTTKDVEKVPYKTLNIVLQKIEEALAEETDLIRAFEFKGIKYGFIPNLDTISTGEWIDIDTYQKERKDLYKVLSVLYRPVTSEVNGRYDIESYDGKVNEDFKELPMCYVKGALVFFCDLGMELLSYIRKCLEESSRKDSVMQELRHLAKSGVGMGIFMDYVMETSSNLMKLRSKYSLRHYFGRVTY